MSAEIERFQDYKRRKMEELAETYEERRAYALAHGTRRAYLLCPLCGLNRVLHQHVAGEARFLDYDPERPLLQTRIGGGKRPGGAGVGFFNIEEEGYNLEQVRESFPELYEHLVEHVTTLAGILGIIEEVEELEEVEDVAIAVDMEGEEIEPPPIVIGSPYMLREQIVYLHRIHPDYNYSQIAELVGCSAGYVGQTIRRWRREGVWWTWPQT